MCKFVAQLDDDRIVKAIQHAEGGTSAQIRVFVTKKALTDPVAAAESQFAKLKMEKTRHRNGVLILVAPASRNFAVFGDRGVHEKCGEQFWRKVADEMASHFKSSAATEAIVHGITRAGKLLAEHFPRTADDTNELPDRVERD